VGIASRHAASSVALSHVGGRHQLMGVSWPDTLVSGAAGITLSPAQVKRGTELAKEQGVNNANFQVRALIHSQVGQVGH